MKNVKNLVNWKQQNKMKTFWPKFDFYRVYLFQIDDDSDKIWTFSKTDHIHFFALEVRQISQNFLWKPFWSSITPHKKLIKSFLVIYQKCYISRSIFWKQIRLFKRKLFFHIKKHWKFNFFSPTFNFRILEQNIEWAD